MSDPTLLAIDQGTTSSRAMIFSNQGNVLAAQQKELTLYYPHKGWVEQDPTELWQDTLWACKSVLQHSNNVASIGITNQRETTIIWDRATGEPIYNAIVWQDRRTADFCQQLKTAGHEAMISTRTGLLLDPYFSATKILWILDNIKGARQKAEAGELAFGTVDSWLLWNLTNGAVHATDATNAARTLLFNIVTQCWDDELLKLFDIPRSLLPQVNDNVSDFGYTSKSLFGKEIPIGAMVGDQQAALIGQACFNQGMVKATYGTGCFALINIGGQFRESKSGMLTTIAYRLNGETTYAIEGSIFSAGSAIQWLRDGLGLFANAAQSEALATSVPDNNGVYFVPAFSGLGAPHWNPHARATISGLTRESTAAHITRAALEAQAYQTLDLLAAMQADSQHNPEVIRADGGLMANEFVCQFVADMLEKPVEIPQHTETTAKGAAYLAGLHAGIYSGLNEISDAWHCHRRYEPSMNSSTRNALYDGWKEAIAPLLNSP
ncbi:MAG: glycerol kinase GlpK [Pseudomonadales bacterium]|nr:glycerol kinase GlpK [Pseudomonadales bacterium]